MRFAAINGTDADRWRWFEFTDANGQKVEVELYQPDMTEYGVAARRYKLGTDAADMPGLLAHVARLWFRAFDGATDAIGAPLQNTPEVRTAMLVAAPDFAAWVIAKLGDAAAWREEKNGDSGRGC